MSGRGERIRTSGLFDPNEARYQAALHPDISVRLADCKGLSKGRYKVELTALA